MNIQYGIAVTILATFTLNVDGMLGSDYLRRFKVSIDYDNQVVDIEPCCPEAMSAVVA